jgi:hypothetical protein
MPERRRPVAVPAPDPLLEALVELARSAIRNDRDATERRGKMTPLNGGKRGRAA